MKHGHKFLIGTLVAVMLAVTLALISAGWQGALAAQRIIYVDADAAGANTGTSWDDAFPTLQQALDIASAGDQIWVAAGTYKPAVEYEGTGNRFKSFQMKNGVAIYGGFDPDAGDVAWGHRDWMGNPTILSGDRGAVEDGLDDSYHVFYHPAGTVDGSALLDGFIITGGSAKAGGDASPHRYGGGMYNGTGSSPTLRNVAFVGNSAVGGGGMYNGTGSSPALNNVAFEDNEADSGGGMYNLTSLPTLNNVTFAGNWAGKGGGMYNITGAEPVLTDCAFEGNEAGSDGGGMYNLESSPVLSNVTFAGNSAYHGGGMHNKSSAPTLSGVTFAGNSANSCGGGMCNEFSSPTLIDCDFEGNEAGPGGGMYNYDSSPTLINCTFSGNSAAGGGGMANYFSSPTLTGCTFLDNSVGDRGGGMYNLESSPSLTSCAFRGNSAGRDGGGIFNVGFSSQTLTNCILAGNSAGRYGGGMYSEGGLATLTNCTLSGNEALLGGGVFIDRYVYLPGRLVLTNCILWGDANPEIEMLSASVSVTYSDIQGGWEGEGNIDLDPRFVDPDNGDFHLGPDSPCIDAGSNDAPYGLPEYDFEGDPRVLDGDGDGAAIVDMGVDESVAGSVLDEE